MIEATKEFFTKYACFKGRTSRANYWWTILGIFLLSFVVLLVAQLIFGAPPVIDETAEAEVILKAYFGSGFVIISMIWDLLLVIPSIAICVRRLHDTNKSGWWYLLNFVPFGGLVLLVFYLSPAVNEGNRY